MKGEGYFKDFSDEKKCNNIKCAIPLFIANIIITIVIKMVSLVILALFNRNTPLLSKEGGKEGGRLYFFISAVLPGRWAWRHSVCRHRH